jgi:hypothetical protein
MQGNLGAQFGMQGNLGGQFGLQGMNRYQFDNAARQNAALAGNNVRNTTGVGGANDEEAVLANAQNNLGNRLTYEQLLQRRNNNKNNDQGGKGDAQQAGQKKPGADNKLDPHASIASAAAAEDLGDSFQYVIEDKVSLPRQQSALLPIVDRPVQATRLSIYNEAVHAKFPMLGLRFKNSTGLPLAQGAVTVFDGGSYAGDARLPDLQPNEDRLLSYAVDLGTEVKAEDRLTPGPQITLGVGNRQLRSRFTLQTTRTYTVKNRSPQPRQAVIEQPIRTDWKLTGDHKPREFSRDVYRFEVPVPAGESVKYDVAEEQVRVEPFSVRANPQVAEEQHLDFGTGLGLDVRQVIHAATPELLGVKLAKGVAHAGTRLRETRTYRVVNRSDQDREVTLEHTVRPEWKLVGDAKPVAGSGDLYRFTLKLAKGQTAEQVVTEERQAATAEGLLKLSDDTVKHFLESPAVSAAVKAALRQSVERKASLVELAKQLEELTKQLTAITEEQSRLRANLKEVPKESPNHQRYLLKLDKQETEIEGLQEQLKAKSAAQQQQKKDLDAMAETLTVE